MNLTETKKLVSNKQRAELLDQTPFVVWFTGISGAGKSTLANLVDRQLVSRGHHTAFLDGDSLRLGLNKDLGFSDADRQENIRRVGEVARLMADAGLIVICAFISPFRAGRDAVRALFEPNQFVEVFVDTPLSRAQTRDKKGLYEMSRKGNLTQLTGLDSPYERPSNPEIHIVTDERTAEACAVEIVDALKSLLGR